MTRNAENILRMTRDECLRGMKGNDPAVRRAWYYTHCGEIEFAGASGLITSERMNELSAEWRKHNPTAGDQRRNDQGAPDNDRAAQMANVAEHANALLHLTQPDRDICVKYVKVDAESITRYTEWQRSRNGLLEGGEYFIVWDNAPAWDTDEPYLLYAVCVTFDSILTAAAELVDFLSRKF